MTGQEYLNFIVGTTSQIGMADKNISDTEYRALALQWLNLVGKDIGNRQQNWHWKFLEVTATAPTVANQHSYDLPTDIDTTKILAVYDRNNDITYTYTPYEKFVRLVPDPSNNTGDSHIWTIFANTLRLWPIPSSVFTLFMDYVRTMTSYADNGVAGIIPAKYDTVVIDGILSWAYRFDKELGDFASQIELYEAGVRRMIIDNKMNVGSLAKRESHRTKRQGELISFPLANN